MKVTDHYHIEELVHPLYIERFGVEKVAKYLPKYVPQLFVGQEAVRVFAGCPVVVNDYMWDKDWKRYGWEGIKDNDSLFINSGLRILTDPLGKGFSGHYFSVCADSKPEDYDPLQLQNDILEDHRNHLYITRMENAAVTKTWLHKQYGHRQPSELIEVFNP